MDKQVGVIDVVQQGELKSRSAPTTRLRRWPLSKFIAEWNKPVQEKTTVVNLRPRTCAKTVYKGVMPF